jgi:1,4-alpha-glucan branching enzyme
LVIRSVTHDRSSFCLAYAVGLDVLLRLSHDNVVNSLEDFFSSLLTGILRLANLSC